MVRDTVCCQCSLGLLSTGKCSNSLAQTAASTPRSTVPRNSGHSWWKKFLFFTDPRSHLRSISILSSTLQAHSACHFHFLCISGQEFCLNFSVFHASCFHGHLDHRNTTAEYKLWCPPLWNHLRSPVTVCLLRPNTLFKLYSKPYQSILFW